MRAASRVVGRLAEVSEEGGEDLLTDLDALPACAPVEQAVLAGFLVAVHGAIDRGPDAADDIGDYLRWLAAVQQQQDAAARRFDAATGPVKKLFDAAALRAIEGNT
jgi:hypothetical protein